MSELDFRFLTTHQIIAIHDYALQNDGGRPGVRDRNALESLVLTPQRTAAYEMVDAFDLAAVYAHSANHNPAFVDGNKLRLGRTNLWVENEFWCLRKWRGG